MFKPNELRVYLTEEDVLNLRIARDKLFPISDPGTDLEILTIDNIIEQFEQSKKEMRRDYGSLCTRHNGGNNIQ